MESDCTVQVNIDIDTDINVTVCDLEKSDDMFCDFILTYFLCPTTGNRQQCGMAEVSTNRAHRITACECFMLCCVCVVCV